MTRALIDSPAVEHFGRYDLLRRIAVGGMGEIFVARERRRNPRLVAIKRLLPQLATEEKYVQMFLDEARLAERIAHPGICKVYEHGTVGDEPFLAMEWVQGVSLRALLQRSRAGLPVVVVIRILADVADALEYSHQLTDERGRSLEVIHRDTTPPNIMVTFEGATKLIDFGLARARTQRYRTESGYVKGKLRYLAPEQLDEGRTFDWRVDVFALGLCGFEALTGRHLFDAASPVDALQAIQQYSGPPRIVELRADIPLALEAVLRRALARKPAMRFQSVARMQEALEKVLSTLDPTFDRARTGELVRRLFPEEAAAAGS